MILDFIKLIVIAAFVCPVQATEKSLQPSFDTKNQTIGIIFLGDTGAIGEDKNKVAQAIAGYCTTQICSMGLLLGDNFYNDGVKDVNDPQFDTKFAAPYKNLKFKFYPVLGNHDVRGNWQAQIDYSTKLWQMGGRFYNIDTNLVQLFALDTNLYVLQENHQQQAWLEAKLANTTAAWKIVYGHHPVFSNGTHGDTEELVLLLNPLLVNNKIDFYLSGHDHDKELIETDGIKYIIMGTGAKLRPIQAGDNSIFAKSSFGFGHLLLTPKSAVLRIVDENGNVEFEKTYNK